MKRRFAFLFLALTTLFVMPTLAQDSKPTLATVSYNGISFSYDPSLGAVLPQTAAEVADIADTEAGGYWPKHIAFSFIYGNEGDMMYSAVNYPQLGIYKIDDITTYNSDFYNKALQDLSGLTEANTKADLSKYENVSSDNAPLNLPHIPFIPAGQIIRAATQYLPINNGTGIRYLAAYSSDVSPLTSDRIMYVYQGTVSQSSGGKPIYYVAFSYPVKASVLPAEIPSDFDYNAFSNNYVKEMNAAIQKINAADPNTFNPTLAALDDLVKSIKIEG